MLAWMRLETSQAEVRSLGSRAAAHCRHHAPVLLLGGVVALLIAREASPHHSLAT